MKTTKAMAFGPAVPLLGMYILMHVQNDEHTERFTGALFVKKKQKVGSCPDDESGS